jgi:hypothetical protein
MSHRPTADNHINPRLRHLTLSRRAFSTHRTPADCYPPRLPTTQEIKAEEGGMFLVEQPCFRDPSPSRDNKVDLGT